MLNLLNGGACTELAGTLYNCINAIKCEYVRLGASTCEYTGKKGACMLEHSNFDFNATPVMQRTHSNIHA